MPIRAQRPCSKCKRLHREKRCPYCTPIERRQAAASRINEHHHLYGTQWQKLRLMVLREQPLCVECQKIGRLTVATVLDHITPHKGDMDLFYRRDNLQQLCATCHNRKTASEDGGFGNKDKSKASSACGADGLPVDNMHHWNYPGGG